MGCDWRTFIPAIRTHLDLRGFGKVEIRGSDSEPMAATRLEPDHPVVHWAANSIAATTGVRPAILPNLGGSLPNDCFADVLALPTIWVPHSYPACSQYAPDEHMLAAVAREGLMIMTGLFWDLGIPAARPFAHPVSSDRRDSNRWLLGGGPRRAAGTTATDLATIPVSRV